MNDNLLYTASVCTAVSLAVLVLRWQRRGKQLPYPPGPTGYPLIGSALNVPQDIPIWQTFTPLAQKHNTDVLYVKLFSTEFVILNSPEAISDLLDKRSAIYSDRPTNPMLELMDLYSWNFVVLGYGNTWRRRRRLFHRFFNMQAVANFDDYQRKHAHRFISHLSRTPEDFFDHIHFVIGALIMEITYGMDIKSHEDKFLQVVSDAIKSGGRVMIPGAFLVNTYPILKHVPRWFPGAGFKRFAEKARKTFDVAVNGPLEWVKDSLKSGSANVSVASTCFDQVAELQNQGFDEDDIRAVTSTTYIAAVGASVGLLRGFFLMMALHPHVLRKAQGEIDRVVGNERLPELSDWENLPYISAVMKELLRWSCPVPFGVVKRAMEDGVYKGYLIPAGVNIVENIWAICYNETVFPAPHTYDPERFLKDGKLDGSVWDPEERVFGSGRRICPGKHFAMRALFFNIACTLAVFDISEPVGEKLEVKYNEGSSRRPCPFKCVIKPRSAASLKLAGDAGAMANGL